MEVNIEIEFKDTPQPTKFATNSCIALRVKDISLADAPSKLLGESILPIGNWQPEQPLRFKVTSHQPEQNATVSVSAQLYLGRCHGPVRENDYLTDTNHLLHTSSPRTLTQNIKIPLIKYGESFNTI